MAIPSANDQPLAGNHLASSSSTSTDTDTRSSLNSSAFQDHSPPADSPSSPNQNQNLNQNLILNHHPSINFLNNSTPVPSFPPTIPLSALKALQHTSQANFLAQLHHNSPTQPCQNDLCHFSPPLSGPATVRLVEHPPEETSQIVLPHPNPDLSFASPAPNPDPAFASPAPNPPAAQRRISALPNRANTPFKPFRAQPSPLTTAHKPSPLSPSADVPRPPRTPCYPTASAAISGALGPPVTAPATIDRVMAELEHRAQQAPGCGQAIFGPNAANQPAPLPAAVDRFADAHGKQFAKADSIANHYAAKRKIDGPASGPSATAAKRAKVSEFGNPKRVVSEQPDAEKRQALARRQLEMARARRRTGTGPSSAGASASATVQKPDARPAPSRLGAFGRNILRSAVKTVKSALRGTAVTPTGVGFGAPAGLGVGPAKAPLLKKNAPLAKVAPTRTTTAGPTTRLPPAGTRIASAASAALSDAARRRVAAGPSQRAVSASGTAKPITKVPGPGGKGPTTGATAATKTATKISWQPKTTMPKPSAASGPGRSLGTQPQAKPRVPVAGAAQTQSRIPQLRTREGEMIIRPTRTARAVSVCSGFLLSGGTAQGGIGKMKQPTKTTRPIGKGALGGSKGKGKRKSSLAVGGRGSGHRVGSGSGFGFGFGVGNEKKKVRKSGIKMSNK